MKGPKLIGILAILAFLSLALSSCFLGPGPAKVKVKFDLYDGDNSFAATVYVQEVHSGQTRSIPYNPHTPYVMVPIKEAGTYVFYARLLEAPDDYHYGFTSDSPVGYGHMTRGGTQDPSKAGLIALEVKPGGSYYAYINDYRAILPTPGKPVTVPWRSGN